MIDIQNNVAYLAGLSMASERLVEIIRGIPKLEFPKQAPPSLRATDGEVKKAEKDESRRSAQINALSVLVGIATAALAYRIGVLPVANNWPEALIYGVLAGAGSGFWNAVLSYIVQLKDLNKARTVAQYNHQPEAMVSRKAAGQI